MKRNKEFFYTDFNSLGSVMNEIVQNSNLKLGVKKATLFKFWNKVAGKKFEKYSKIESLNADGLLVVSCANAAVSSELLLFKTDILKKINTFAIPLELEVKDIKFSHKMWKNNSQIETSFTQADVNPHKLDLSDYNPNDIVLDEEEVKSIRLNIDSNTFATQQQRDRIFNAIINDLKIQKYIKEKN